MVDDNRRSKRILKRLTVTFGSRDLKHTGLTNDISKNGLFIRTTRHYAQGNILKINLLIPGNGSKTFTGKVVRSYRQPPFTSLTNGVGVELDDPDGNYLTFVTSIEI